MMITGLNRAGKTSLTEVSFEGRDPKEVASTVKTTIGITVKTFSYLGLQMNLVDLGGQKRFRDFYLADQSLYKKTDLLIFVIDIQSEDRFEDSRFFLDETLKVFEEANVNPRICIFFHKYDPTKKNELESNLTTASELFSDIKDQFKTSIFDNSGHNAFRSLFIKFHPEISQKIDDAFNQFKTQDVTCYLVDREGWIIKYSGEQDLHIKTSPIEKTEIDLLSVVKEKTYPGREITIIVKEEENVKRIYPLSSQFFLYVFYHASQEWNQMLGMMLTTLVGNLQVIAPFLKDPHK